MIEDGAKFLSLSAQLRQSQRCHRQTYMLIFATGALFADRKLTQGNILRRSRYYLSLASSSLPSSKRQRHSNVLTHSSVPFVLFDTQ